VSLIIAAGLKQKSGNGTQNTTQARPGRSEDQEAHSA
jgi:hypothetical protein